MLESVLVSLDGRINLAESIVKSVNNHFNTIEDNFKLDFVNSQKFSDGELCALVQKEAVTSKLLEKGQDEATTVQGTKLITGRKAIINLPADQFGHTEEYLLHSFATDRLFFNHYTVRLISSNASFIFNGSL